MCQIPTFAIGAEPKWSDQLGRAHQPGTCFMHLAKILMIGGVALFATGFALYATQRAGLDPIRVLAKYAGYLGRLPGDFSWESGGSRFYFPLTTSLLISAVVSLLVRLCR